MDNNVLFFTAWFFCIICYTGVFIFYHEMSHVQIYQAFGVKSTVSFDGMTATTVAESVPKLTDCQHNTLRALQAAHELYTYPFAALIVFLLLQGFYMASLFLEVRK